MTDNSNERTLTPEEEAEMVERINSNPMLQPNSTERVTDAVGAICDEAVRLAQESGSGNLLWQAAYHGAMLMREQAASPKPTLSTEGLDLAHIRAVAARPYSVETQVDEISYGDLRAILARIEALTARLEEARELLRTAGFSTIEIDATLSQDGGQ